MTLLSASSALVEWDAPADGGAEINQYTVFVYVGTGYSTANAGLDGKHELTSLLPDTVYRVAVQALNRHGRGELSFDTQFRTPVAEPSGDLTVLAVPTITTVDGEDTVELSAWVTGGDSDTYTYRWTSGSGLGSFSATESSDTVWTAPASASATQHEVLTLTVDDANGNSDSATVTVKVPAVRAAEVPPVSQPAARIGYVVEEMLAQPWGARPEPDGRAGPAVAAAGLGLRHKVRGLRRPRAPVQDRRRQFERCGHPHLLLGRAPPGGMQTDCSVRGGVAPGR